MKRYSLRQAARLLGVGRSTLRRWLKQAGMTPARQAGDNRRRVLSHDEMQMLAALHHRVIAVVPISDTDRIAELERKIKELLRRVDAMETARSRLLVMDSDEIY